MDKLITLTVYNQTMNENNIQIHNAKDANAKIKLPSNVVFNRRQSNINVLGNDNKDDV